MLTDIGPVVERLLRKLVLAGLPLVAACDGQRSLDGQLGSGGTSVAGTGGSAGAGGAASTGGVGGGVVGSGGIGSGGAGTGGVGTGGFGTGGAGTGGSGTGGAVIGTGGAMGCVPLSFGCGFRSTCPAGPDGGVGPQLPLTMRDGTFAPDDPRLVDLYRACLMSTDHCSPDCKGFCFMAVGLPADQYEHYFSCDVTCGTVNAVKIGYESAVCGRRPSGGARRRACHGRPQRADSPLGRLLAEAAELEAASVPAFAQLAADLAAHGAPETLVRAARVARADEARHWQRTREVARRKGANPVRPAVVRRTEVSSLEALAADNVIEGCVRETFGALVAAHQAATAEDREVAGLMAGIAGDEMEHAALAWRIDAWATERLGRASAARRQTAARAALRELVAGAMRPVEGGLRAAAGLPSPAESAALLAATWDVLWKPAFGALARS